ncbi:MAG: thiol-disulfide isomerase [Candidatus Nitrosopolaris wilkensis]|nr:MAG: thiol-disulfide isomerase [Candidatus Nitrosopolaris wilkensis]
MNRDNVSAVAMAIAVIAIIVGFGVYFNSPSLNKASSSSQQQLEKVVSAATTTNGTIKSIKLDKAQFLQIDKSQFQKAPEFAQIAGYIHTPSNAPLTLASLKGKVVLVDFWTYSCINCIRTLPHLNDWYQRYADKGFVIVGVHSPEFEFEKNYDNVKAVVQKLGIKFPVILDSNHGTWNAYGNMYWPRDYLVDTQGYIRHDHIGEGDYNTTESAIQSLLAEGAALNGMKDISFNTAISTTTINPGSLAYVDLTKQITPEIYLGYSFARAPLGNPQNFQPDQTIPYSIPPNTNFNPDIIYLDGQWKNNPDNMELQSNTGHIILTYNARAVNIVAGGHGQRGIVTEDGATKILNNSLGKDLTPDGKFVLDGQRLYNLALYNNYGSHSIIINVSGKGFQLYTFTFG